MDSYVAVFVRSLSKIANIKNGLIQQVLMIVAKQLLEGTSKQRSFSFQYILKIYKKILDGNKIKYNHSMIVK